MSTLLGKKIGRIASAKNAKKILWVILKEGTAWVLLAGAVILLTADVWLGASVLIEKGMSQGLAWILSVGISALQISLFVHSGKIIQGANTHWQRTMGIVSLAVGWIIVLGDSLLDSFAAFVQISHRIPNGWSGVGELLDDPVTLICFITFFVLSFLGERLARLVIAGLHDENYDDEVMNHRTDQHYKSSLQTHSNPGKLPNDMDIQMYLRKLSDGRNALVVGEDGRRYTVSQSDIRLVGKSPMR